MVTTVVTALSVVALLASIGAAAFTAQRNKKAQQKIGPLAARLGGSQPGEDKKGAIRALAPLACLAAALNRAPRRGPSPGKMPSEGTRPPS